MAEFITPMPDGVKSFNIPHKEMHYLKKPQGYVSGMAQGNLGYQMAYSIQLLEEQMVQEGRCFVLQLNMKRHDDDWQNPDYWNLYANGILIANGSGEFAQSCFESSAEEFITRCKAALNDSTVEPLSEHDYRLLKTAQKIASYEPFDAGASSLGSKPYRVF